MNSMVLLTLQNVAFTLLADGGWSLSKFLGNSKNLIANVGAAICIVLGAIMVIVALVKVATGLLSHGKKQTEWVPIVVLGVVGILFLGSAALIKTTVATDSTSNDLTNAFSNMGTSDDALENSGWDLDTGDSD